MGMSLPPGSSRRSKDTASVGLPPMPSLPDSTSATWPATVVPLAIAVLPSTITSLVSTALTGSPTLAVLDVSAEFSDSDSTVPAGTVTTCMGFAAGLAAEAGAEGLVADGFVAAVVVRAGSSGGGVTAAAGGGDSGCVVASLVAGAAG